LTKLEQLQQWFEETFIVLVITLTNSSSQVKKMQVSPLYIKMERKKIQRRNSRR
jgi:hypothetical protein